MRHLVMLLCPYPVVHISGPVYAPSGRLPRMPGWSGAWAAACAHAERRVVEEAEEDPEMDPRSDKYDPLHRWVEGGAHRAWW